MFCIPSAIRRTSCLRMRTAVSCSAAVVASVLGFLIGLPAPSHAAPHAGQPTQGSALTFPVRGAFYYPWYPATWTVGGQYPHFAPTLGYYDSSNAALVDQHVRALDYARVKLAIASWFGPGTQSESARIPLLLDRSIALGSPLRWTLYYEKEEGANPSVAELQSDLAYIRTNYASRPGFASMSGKPVIFVWNAGDTSCEVASRWSQASAGNWFVVLKLFSGYRDCVPQPDSWHQYGPASAMSHHSGYSFSISPGFWRADQPTPILGRDLGRWQQHVREMVASQEPWQLVTTFNEWGEGTATESAAQWASGSGYGAYLDALHDNGGIPTSVVFQSAGAARTHAGVVVRWRTAADGHQLGFNLYRAQNGTRVRLNRTIIRTAVTSTAVGHSYSWLDHWAPRRDELRYWLEAISAGGARSSHGPIVVR